MAKRKAGTVWKGEEQRRTERRITERRDYGRELTNAERSGQERRRTDRRIGFDRRQQDIDSAHEHMAEPERAARRERPAH